MKGGGDVTVLKLRYCPECGSIVQLYYGHGISYWDVTWQCTDQDCYMSKQDRPLHGWNEVNVPNYWAKWTMLLNEINFLAQCAEVDSSAKAVT